MNIFQQAGRLSIAGMIMLGFFLVIGASSQQTAEELYEAAIMKKEAEGNLEAAVKLFREVIATYPENRSVAAKAQLQIGLCYEKLGKQAIKAYELVLKNYADQPEVAAAARERLAALKAKVQSMPSTKLVEGELAAMAQAFSPDGTKMTVTPLDKKGWNIAVYDFSSKQLDYITRYGWEKMTYNSCWSPDGKEIAFGQSGLQQEGPAEIAVSTLERKIRILYRVDNIIEAVPVPYCWLGDSSAVVASLLNPDATGILGLIPLSGGSFKPLRSFKRTVNKFERIADSSPDGCFIVFQERNVQDKHDLYIIGTDGGSPEVLSDHPADESSPRWSPDGKHIVFYSDRFGTPALCGIAIKDGKRVGEAFLIETGQFPMISWIKKGLTYHKSLALSDIFTVSIDPETLEIQDKPRQLAYTPTGANVRPIWSPDGKYLAFGVNMGRKIAVLPIDGGESKEFVNPDTRQQIGAFHDLRWLPDGSGLSLSGLDGDGKLALFQLDLESGEWNNWPIPGKRWTRTERTVDGKAFLYARHGSFHNDPGIIERDLETGAERYVYKPEGGRGNIFRQLRFSKDFTKLAFTEDGERIKLIDMETGKHRDLTSEYHGSLAFSPDGKHIISTGVPDKMGQTTAVFLISCADGSVKRLDLGFPKDTIFRNFDWSPDGRQLAFMVGTQKFEIHLMKNVIPEDKK